MLVFEWDETKRVRNIAEHGTDFEVVQTLDWEGARYLPDLRRDYMEGRIQGFVPLGRRLHVIIFTIRNTGLRVISLRKANKRESLRYAEAPDNH